MAACWLSYIYNSRNYEKLLDPTLINRPEMIYNSRNYEKLLDFGDWLQFSSRIYNSRNYEKLLDGLDVLIRLSGSTTVEIMRSF